LTDKDFTAHEILAQHMTNVSPVTAKVIANAIVEHEKLRALVDDLARERTRELLARPSDASTTQALEAVTSALVTLSDVIASVRGMLVPLQPPEPLDMTLYRATVQPAVDHEAKVSDETELPSSNGSPR
jgi:hypothetical protein